MVIIIINNGDMFTKQTPACLYKWCPSCIGPIWRHFFLYIQREIELCSMVYSELIPNAMPK